MENHPKKKRLMLISPMLHQGGFERVCITTARLLQPYYDITIVIFNSANIAYDITGLSIIDLKLGVKKSKLGKLLQVFRRRAAMKKVKRQIKPHIAYSFGPTANIINALSGRKEEKIWLGLRNYTDVEEEEKIRLFIKKADLMICCSRILEEKLQKRYEFRKTTTLYNPYDVESIRKKAMEKEPALPWPKEEKGHILISMGRDDDMKGFWHMLKAFYCIQEKVPDTRLVILGAGTFKEYKALAKDLGIEDKVYFGGMCKDPYSYLRKASIYLLTSLNEGFPNALVEGMCLGLAPVSVDCMTGPREILLKDYKDTGFDRGEKIIWGDYGILLPEMSRRKNLDSSVITEEERNYAQVVISLLEDKELLLSYQNRALKRAGIFTQEHYVRQLLSYVPDCE